MARRRSRRKFPLIRFALFCVGFTVLVLLCLQAVLFFRSDRGRAWLLVHLGQERTPGASSLLANAVRGALRAAGASERETRPVMNSDSEEEWRLRLPPTVSLTQANFALASAIADAGGRVLAAAETRGGDCDTLEVRFGLGNEPTHRVVFTGERDAEPATRARLALLLEDVDPRTDNLLCSPTLLSSYLGLHEPLSFGVIPSEGASLHSEAIAASACEVLMYLPMESKGHGGSGRIPVAVEVSMRPAQIRQRVAEHLGEITHVAGVVNYQGELATQDPEVMRAVLEETRDRRLFFVDAGTTDRSAVRAAAVELGAPCLSGTLRLDAGGGGEPALRARLEQAAELAQRTGGAVAMGRMTPELLEVLREELPRLRARGVQLVKASELARMGR